MPSGLAFVRMARSVREHLDQEHRFAHTLGVTRVAELLAAAHHADTGRARMAGLFHDLARLYPAQRLLDECARRGLEVGPFERRNPVVLHAPVGAELARERFGVDDEAVLSAIRKHTLGDAEMSTLDQVLFLADALEPGRDFAERAAFLEVAFRDLEAAMRVVLQATLAYLRARGLTPAPQTLAAQKRFERQERLSA